MERKCSKLTKIKLGIVHLTGYEIGGIATFQCNNGFVLQGNQVRQCLNTGQWTGFQPECRRKFHVFQFTIQVSIRYFKFSFTVLIVK